MYFRTGYHTVVLVRKKKKEDGERKKKKRMFRCTYKFHFIRISVKHFNSKKCFFIVVPRKISNGKDRSLSFSFAL